jgi:AcrR family transcriptional regulator
MARERLTAEERKSQIIDAALKLGIKKGYYCLTIREIEEASGVSRSLISYHFTIDELRKAMVKKAIAEEIRPILQQALSIKDRAVRKLSVKLKKELLRN